MVLSPATYGISHRLPPTTDTAVRREQQLTLGYPDTTHSTNKRREQSEYRSVRVVCGARSTKSKHKCAYRAVPLLLLWWHPVATVLRTKTHIKPLSRTDSVSDRCTLRVSGNGNSLCFARGSVRMVEILPPTTYSTTCSLIPPSMLWQTGDPQVPTRRGSYDMFIVTPPSFSQTPPPPSLYHR